MTTGAPRSLRELDDRTLEAARLAARRSGLPIPEWLNTAITRQATAEGSPPRRTSRDDVDEDALAAAIESLTHRVRAIDQHSCFVLTDLNERLDEIARRAGAVAGAKRRGKDSPLAGIAAFVENLSRDIDNADETARTTIEGMRASSREATQAGEIGRVAHAIRRLGEQFSLDSEPSRLKEHSATAAGLDAIRTRLEALLAESLQAPPDTGLNTPPYPPKICIEEARDGADCKFADEEAAGVAARRQSINDHIDIGALTRGQRQIEQSLDTLHEGLTALSGRLAAMTATNATSKSIMVDALGRLESRLDVVLDRVDTILERSASGDAIDEIKLEIDGIRQDIAERELPIAAQIESRLAGIADRLDGAREADRLRPHFKDLEEQVARLASESKRGAAHAASLKDIEARLLHLENLLLASRREWVEVAGKAARDAAREVAESARGVDPGRALERDLENAHRACSAADWQMHATNCRTAGVQDLVKATGTDDAGAAMRLVEPGPTFRASSLGTDVVRPGLAASRGTAKSAARGQHGETIDRKADFIAAARRAAQATAETATRRATATADAGDLKAGAFTRIGKAIRNRRRALLGATAALVFAMPAAHMFEWEGPAALEGRSVGPSSVATGGDNGDDSAVVNEIVSPSTTPEIPKAAPVAAEPPYRDPSTVAFAAPGPLYARFRDTPLAPPRSFVRPPDRRGLLPLVDAIGSGELREAAAAGDPNAAVEVAARYAQGRLVPRDLVKAAQWYEVAAEQGVAVAQYRLASLYERGRGVARDLSVAADWYRRAAEQGNTGAMHNLAVMMSAGVDGIPNYPEAVGWFRAAADRGVADSQYNLGVIYARGLGQDRNLIESYKWFAVAATSGDRESAAHRDEIGSALSADDLAKARTAADAWQPAPTRVQANVVATLSAAWSDSADGITEADRRALVMEIQTALAEQGYDPGPADGFEGPRTRQAVRAFQRKTGLAETGTISRDLVAALADPSG